jgi:hypothetical protein
MDSRSFNETKQVINPKSTVDLTASAFKYRR